MFLPVKTRFNNSILCYCSQLSKVVAKGLCNYACLNIFLLISHNLHRVPKHSAFLFRGSLDMKELKTPVDSNRQHEIQRCEVMYIRCETQASDLFSLPQLLYLMSVSI